MALNMKTIFKIFLLFFVFQLNVNLFIETMPLVIEDISTENQQYLNFLTIKTNAELDSEEEGRTLKENLYNAISTTDYFSGGFLADFWGLLRVIGNIILFIVGLVINMLFIPGIVFEMLMYNFIFSSSYLFALEILFNVYFYMHMFYIIYRERINK